MSITLIFGSMYSGKTTELIRRITRYHSINKRVLVVNSRLDDRYSGDESIVSHDKITYNCVKATTLSEIEEKTYIDVDVIAIDEGQFFTDLKEYVLKFCEEHGKTVIIAGLISDSQRKKFGNMADLFYVATDLVHLKSLCTTCKDGTLGIFTKKLCSSVNQIDVGSTDKYIALCRACYLK